MGTPYCITIDEETINNDTVTIRDRDTMEQTTIKVEDIEKYIEERPKDTLPELYPIGLALGTYIVCENEKGIYLIDQHAAEERINYERNSYLLAHPSGNTITPLIPNHN